MYDELVYLLDLCIFSYHLHAQTLIWPMDPYYEQLLIEGGSPITPAQRRARRNRFISVVRTATANQVPLHGPGSCQGNSTSWASNNLLDPVIAKYEQICPWRPAFARPDSDEEPWIVYNTPPEITDLIGDVRMVRYDTTSGPYGTLPPPSITVDKIYNARPGHPGAKNLLFAFEGGTGAIAGDKTERRYAAWALMGFVLARTITNDELQLKPSGGTAAGYDVYIVFRGSRSGKLRPKESAWKEKGNPDWVTDMDLFSLVADKEFTASGSLCRGFLTSLQSMLPTVMRALEEIHAEKRQPPRTIYVTGHSLGAALACHFTSAMLSGNKYGPPYGVGTAMPDALKMWPWRSIQLITYSSPVVGDVKFQTHFDTNIGSRRVWLDGDPITQERRHYLVGVPLRIRLREEGDYTPRLVVVRKDSHEPRHVRRNLIRTRLSKGISMTNVPAGSGKEDLAEPWRVFKRCADMIRHLETIQNSVPLETLLPHFIEHLTFYLTILQQSEPLLSSASTDSSAVKLRNLIANLSDMKKPASSVNLAKLEKYWTSASLIQLDEGFFDFLGLCVFLAGLSKGLGKNVSALISGNDEYNHLLGERI